MESVKLSGVFHELEGAKVSQCERNKHASTVMQAAVTMAEPNIHRSNCREIQVRIVQQPVNSAGVTIQPHPPPQPVATLGKCNQRKCGASTPPGTRPLQPLFVKTMTADTPPPT